MQNAIDLSLEALTLPFIKANQMTTPEQYKALSAAHYQSKAALTTARKSLRVLSHAALAGHQSVTQEVLAAAAVKVARLENAEATARIAAQPSAA